MDNRKFKRVLQININLYLRREEYFLNPKINKVIGDIEKTKEKIIEFQSRLKELERLKTELENADIVAMVRGIKIPPADLEAFARAFMEQKETTAVPDITVPPVDKAAVPDIVTPPVGKTSSTAEEDDKFEK